MNPRSIGLALLALVALTSSPARASWLSDFTGVNIDVPAGKVQIGPPDPVGAIQRLPQTVQNLPQDIANLANPAGLALAFAVRQAKAQAAFGARPIPPDVYGALSRFYTESFLHSVSYNTFDNARIALDSAVMLLNNDVSAITLEDIIVFRNEADAHNRIGQLLASAPQATFAYFWVVGNYLYGDAQGNLYPADPQTGNVTGPVSGRVFLQNGQWGAQDLSGQLFLAARVL